MRSEGHMGNNTCTNSPPIVNWGCQLTQVVLYNGCKMVVVVVVVYTKDLKYPLVTLAVSLLRHDRREWALLSFHSVCLSVWMSVGHSTTYSLPWLIDHNQIWSAVIYLSSDLCKPFWIPCLPYFGCQREKYAKFCLFPTCILATANVTHRAIWLVINFSGPYGAIRQMCACVCVYRS